MRNLKSIFFSILLASCFQTNAQNFSITSPDKNISITIDNGEKLSYSVKFKDRIIVETSQLGFELPKRSEHDRELQHYRTEDRNHK